MHSQSATTALEKKKRGKKNYGNKFFMKNYLLFMFLYSIAEKNEIKFKRTRKIKHEGFFSHTSPIAFIYLYLC